MVTRMPLQIMRMAKIPVHQITRVMQGPKITAILIPAVTITRIPAIIAIPILLTVADPVHQTVEALALLKIVGLEAAALVHQTIAEMMKEAILPIHQLH